jgi:hypothetical protein
MMSSARLALLVLRSKKGRQLVFAAIVGTLVGVGLGIMVVTSTIGAIFSMCQLTVDTISSREPGPTPTYTSSTPSELALNEIPKKYYEEYKKAGEEYGIDWAILGGVGYIETKHGEGGKEVTCINSSVGAQGPMQFMPATWSSVGVDGNGDGKRDVCHYQDAIPSAAKYLRDGGAPGDYRASLFQYNHADWYVDDVLAKAEEYRKAAETQDGSGGDGSGAPEDGDGAPSPTPALLNPLLDPFISVAHAQEAPQGSGQPPLGWDTVDESRNIHYQLDSKYAESFEKAVASWNELGGVNIEPTPSPSETDLIVMDGSADGAMAVTQSDGDMIFDPTVMDGATANAKEAAAMHELGHALGFEHTESPSVLNTPIITNATNNYTEPTSYDIGIYRDTWGGSGSTSDTGSGDGSGDGSGSGSGGSGPGGAGSGSTPRLEDPKPVSNSSLPAYCKPFQLAGLIKDIGQGISNLGGGSGGGGNGGEIKGTGTGKEVVEEAMKYDGVSYVLGGLSACIPGEQMDCTCLTRTVFEKFGYSGNNALPDMPQELRNYGQPVEGEPKAGDVLIWPDPGDGTGGHAGIATGDGGVFHCASAKLGCLYAKDYKAIKVGNGQGVDEVRRLVGSEGSESPGEKLGGG